MNPDQKAEHLRLKEEAAAAIELDVTLPNFLAGGCAGEQSARRHAYEEAMAERMLRESADRDPQPQRPRHRREDL